MILSLSPYTHNEVYKEIASGTILSQLEYGFLGGRPKFLLSLGNR